MTWLDYRRPYSMDFLVDARTKRITEIRFNKAFARRAGQRSEDRLVAGRRARRFRRRVQDG